ncbi:MAG: DUF4124 domain-containing protein [Rudaea sp.]
MDDGEIEIAGRSMRWYEWLVCLVVLLLASGARAGPVYRCTDARGNTAFTDISCAAGDSAQTFAAAPAPPFSPSPHYELAGRDSRDAVRAARRGSAAATEGRHEASTPAARSFECRSVDGQVFYRHAACPHTIDAKPDGFGRGRAAKKKVEVHVQRVSREEACTQMRRAGASGRSGHGHDEDVSSYEKNLGHDPCR